MTQDEYTPNNRVERLATAINQLIDYYIDEYDLLICELIGVLRCELLTRERHMIDSMYDDDDEETAWVEEE